ncbi:hypothetical protein Smp_171400 [Schistosoma mansoni]|uniref:hypothetical protein n=1 Tax=Schistosoma mansoni TaxID=6183 RepID=UPI0001A62140|nr:hypothetical protein Smp_171400 [Schistosoma mansoni]|eukprot:XP_018655180.1 hypothetical protein Smp_171400 [Schistosoma mansoni]
MTGLIYQGKDMKATSNAEDNHLPTISATGSNNIGDVIIPFSPTERNGEQVNETEGVMNDGFYVR